MVHSLYWICALVLAIALSIILYSEQHKNKVIGTNDIKFRRLMKWVIFFCIQDIFWGLSAGQNGSARALFAASTIFHLSTVLTTFFWLDYTLSYLGDMIQHRKHYLTLDLLVIIWQVFLLVINFFRPTVFYIGEGGTYCTGPLRWFAFFNQYVVYLLVAIFVTIAINHQRAEEGNRYYAVIWFTLAPILSGVFQYLYPNGPFYTVGYSLGCIVIYCFIVQRDQDELLRLQSENHKLEQDRLLAEQTALANTDSLTGLGNRRALEEDTVQYKHLLTERDFVYMSADVNALKTVNDSIGHAAGDELICGAAKCLDDCIGRYGRVYRVGGDEFEAVFFADKLKLERIQKELTNTIDNWKGKLVSSLAISMGFVTNQEYPNIPLHEMAKLADTRMYEAKEKYYAETGIDRRGQQQAFNMLCNSCTKILKINLTNDTHKYLRKDDSDLYGHAGYSASISEWLENFGHSPMLPEEDRAAFLEKTSRDYLRTYFRAGKTGLSINYRRLSKGGYVNAIMEIIEAEDYSEDNETAYLYVRYCER